MCDTERGHAASVVPDLSACARVCSWNSVVCNKAIKTAVSYSFPYRLKRPAHCPLVTHAQTCMQACIQMSMNAHTHTHAHKHAHTHACIHAGTWHTAQSWKITILYPVVHHQNVVYFSHVSTELARWVLSEWLSPTPTPIPPFKKWTFILQTNVETLILFHV